jgi:hypothetical protein
MKREDITRMAREAGIDEFGSLDERLIFFAARVAAAEREACKKWFIEDSERYAAQVALAEREACAKVCDDQHGKHEREFERLSAVEKQRDELLEALKALLPILDKAWAFEGDVFGRLHNDAMDADTNARAAIAKATGEPA